MLCDTHLAEDILALDALAKKSLQIMKNMKLQNACKAADKLYHNINMDTHDEEKTYIHVTRYLILLDYIYKTEKDHKFLELRYGSLREDMKKKHAELKSNLINRYTTNKSLMQPKITMEIEPSYLSKPLDTNIFGMDKYITCQQLYEASYKCKNILVMDIRPKNEFENSHLKEFHIINIDEALVVPGLSANTLGENLPNDVKAVYDRRDTFDYIVLLDLDTTPDTYMTSKLRLLYGMLTEWDINTIYKHTPCILKGGYIDFVDRYPTYSTNPNMILHHKYEELDELLDLETISYPDEFANIKEDTNHVNIETDNLYEEILQITSQLLKIEEKLLEKQIYFYDPNHIAIKKRIEAELSDLMAARSKLSDKKEHFNKQLRSLIEKKPRNNIQKKAALKDVEYKIVNVTRQRRKLIESHKTPLEEVATNTSVNKIIETIGDKPSTQLPIEVRKPEIPVVNRSTKPRTLRYKSENLGLVGLVNIRNTCYMNSIIQCFRHLPSIKDFFLSGKFEREITTDHPTLIYETADLIKKLWTGKTKSICPSEFYKKVVALNPMFKRGNHEDANEFFMFVYDHIFEDTATAVPRDKYAEAKFQTLYDRIQYKTSFFVKEFYHQIRTDCICGGCSKRCLKYDIENVLMMGVPERGSCSIEEMFDEFMHTCDISDYYCRNCERKSDIIREFSYQPKIISFLLKRYTYGKGIAEKITVPCDFPIENFRMGRAVYKLWAVSLHQGGMTAGHYTAMCLNSEDGLWYEYNDEYVRPVDINGRHIKERIYMLFYESEDGSETGFSDT